MPSFHIEKWDWEMVPQFALELPVWKVCRTHQTCATQWRPYLMIRSLSKGPYAYQKTKTKKGIFNKRLNEILNEKSFLGKINTLQIEDHRPGRKWHSLLNMRNVEYAEGLLNDALAPNAQVWSYAAYMNHTVWSALGRFWIRTSDAYGKIQCIKVKQSNRRWNGKTLENFSWRACRSKDSFERIAKSVTRRGSESDAYVSTQCYQIDELLIAILSSCSESSSPLSLQCRVYGHSLDYFDCIWQLYALLIIA